MMGQDSIEMIYEFFDLSDDETRQTLISLDESQRDSLLNSLALKFYNDIMNRIDDIDFGTIPDSKGDITKIENFNEMNECLETLSKILDEYKQPKTQIDEIREAIEHMIENRRLFERAFKLKADLPVIIYCTMVLAIVCSVSLMMTSCIEFIKNPVHENFTIEFKKAGYAKTQNSMMYQNILKFNKTARKGDLSGSLESLIQGVAIKAVSEDTELMDDVNINEGFIDKLQSVAGIFGMKSLKNPADYLKPFQGDNLKNGVKDVAKAAYNGISKLPKAVWIPLVSIAVLIGLIWLIRGCIYYFYRVRVAASDYFEAQANILQMNAYSIENSNINKTPEQKDKIMKNQLSIVERFRSLSNFFAIKNKEAEIKTQKDLSNEKYTASDLVGGDSLF